MGKPHLLSIPTRLIKLVKLIANCIISCPSAKISAFDVKNSTSVRYSHVPNVSALKSLTFLTSSSKNTISCITHKIDVSTLKQAKASMACLSQASSPTTFFSSSSERRATTNHPSHLASGTTSGDQSSSSLVVDDLGIKYVGERHDFHLRDFLKKHYEVNEDCEVTKYSGTSLYWDWTKCTCNIYIKTTIRTSSTSMSTRPPKIPSFRLQRTLP